MSVRVERPAFSKQIHANSLVVAISDKQSSDRNDKSNYTSLHILYIFTGEAQFIRNEVHRWTDDRFLQLPCFMQNTVAIGKKTHQIRCNLTLRMKSQQAVYTFIANQQIHNKGKRKQGRLYFAGYWKSQEIKVLSALNNAAHRVRGLSVRRDGRIHWNRRAKEFGNHPGVPLSAGHCFPSIR